jgi:hypothetical protein
MNCIARTQQSLDSFLAQYLATEIFLFLVQLLDLAHFIFYILMETEQNKKHTELCFSFSVLPQFSHQPNGCKELMLIRVDFIVNSGNCVRKTQRI